MPEPGTTEVAEPEIIGGDDGANDFDVEDHSFDESTSKILGRFKSVGSLGKSYAHLLKKQSGTMSLPDENASDEDKATALGAVFTKLGKPETAEGYELTKPDDLPEGMVWSEDMAKSFAEAAHKLHLTKAQAKGLAAFEIQRLQAGLNAQQEENNAAVNVAVEAIKKEVGSDKYEQYVVNANKAQAHAATMVDGLGAFLEETKVGGVALGSHPVMAKLFNMIFAKEIAEDRLVVGAGSGGKDDKGNFFNYENME